MTGIPSSTQSYNITNLYNYTSAVPNVDKCAFGKTFGVRATSCYEKIDGIKLYDAYFLIEDKKNTERRCDTKESTVTILSEITNSSFLKEGASELRRITLAKLMNYFEEAKTSFKEEKTTALIDKMKNNAEHKFSENEYFPLSASELQHYKDYFTEIEILKEKTKKSEPELKNQSKSCCGGSSNKNSQKVSATMNANSGVL